MIKLPFRSSKRFKSKAKGQARFDIFVPVLLMLFMAAVMTLGAVMLETMVLGGVRGVPERGTAVAFVQRGPLAPPGGMAAAPAPVDAPCVPRLVSDGTRDASVLSQIVDKAIDIDASVSVSDGSFGIRASSSVMPLQVTLNPPVTVPKGGTVTIPLPPADRASVSTGGTITCTVEGTTCRAGADGGAGAWSATTGSSGIAARAEHANPTPDQVTVNFAVKGAIDGGAVTGAGLFPAPPSGFIRYADQRKTVAPFMGSATWRCVWVL